jgi:hypothetical protein
MTPTPPTHSMNDRHQWSERGRSSSTAAIVRPVPVKPLMLSKTESSGLRKIAVVGYTVAGAGVFIHAGNGSIWMVQAMRRNGRPPSTPTTAQAEAAVTIASRFSGGAASRYRQTRALPSPAMTMAETRNAGIVKNSMLTAATTIETNSITETACTIRPTSRPTVRVFTLICGLACPPGDYLFLRV